MKTLCQCTEAGHCPRHLCEKTELEVRQCQTDWHHYHYMERKTDNLQPGDPAIDRGPVRCDVLMPYHAGSMEYVEEAVRSILNQNKADVTLHLIGDGIPSEEGLNFPGVRQYFTEKAVGPYAARMLAFDHLETDYILMADSDDIYHPNHCHYAVSCLMDTGRDLFGASMEQFVDYRDRDCEALQHTLNTFPILTSGRAESLVPDGNIVHATLAITREAFEALNGYYDSIVGADTHLVRRAAEAGYKAFISNKIVAQRRLHRTSLTNGPQYGIGTRNRKKIRNVLQSQLKQVEAGANPQQFGRLDKWRTQRTVKTVEPRSTNGKYDIDVFIPYFRNLDLVHQTVDSILWQTGVKPFIHLVNDCSREDDRHLFERYGHLENIAWYKTKRNCGPYAVANSLFHHIRSEFIGIADSDDIYLPGHFRTALTDLNQHDAQAWGSVMLQFLNPLENHTKANIALEKNHPVADSGKKVGLPYPRLVNGTMVVRGETFKKLNGFNGNWHCAADTEFTQRLQFPSDAVSGHKKTAFFSPELTALRRICGNSLSNSAGKYGLRSQERDAIKEESLRRYDLWKTQVKNHGKLMDPQRWGTLNTQDDVLDPEYIPKLHRDGKIIACLTSIPRRMYALGETIHSLIDQVDGIKVHLNDYAHVPEFLKNPKIEVVFGDNSQMSCTKFLWADRIDGYIFTCDDDLIYPPDYIQRMKAAIDKYKCIACAHGSRLMPGKIESYYKDRQVFDARKKVPETVPVDVPGTGVMAWHTDDIKLSMSDFDLPGMEDIAAYRAIYKNSYRAIVVAHPDGWFKSSTHKNDGGLYSDSVRDDSKETEVINAHKNHR